MAATRQDEVSRSDSAVIDCDVHQTWASGSEFARYLPEGFRDRGLTPPGGPNWHNPIAAHGLGRLDAVPEDGSPPGSDYDLLAEQLFEEFGVDRAVLTGPLVRDALACHPNVHYATAASEAYNDWLIAEWLDRDDRFLGGLSVAPGDTDHAVEEIDRVGDHDRMAQVMMPSAHRSPYGDRQYWPIFEAAEDAGLPVGIHVNTAVGVASAPATGAGMPLSYMEKHTVGPAATMGQLCSMVLEGVFEEFPDLTVVFVEQRLSWIPDAMWHMDKLWKGLKDSAPWLERKPSEYVRENVRFSTQPMFEPEKPGHLAAMFEMVHADETVVFSTDYPHWDNDNPGATLDALDRDTRRRVLSGNAREIYGL
jgi:predicted TIM-barrel fold metal-dependent hydrolase